MKGKRLFAVATSALAMILGLVGCNGSSSSAAGSNSAKPSSSQQPQQEKIVVSAAGDKKTIASEETVQLTASVAAGALSDVTWSTSAATVATVSATGLVTGVGAGEATITAKKEGYKNGTITITVTRGGSLLATLHLEQADHYSADGVWGTSYGSTMYGPGDSPVYERSSGNASDGTCIAYFGEGDKETLTFTSSAAISAELVVTMASSNAVEDLSAVETVKFNNTAINLAGKSLEGGSSSEFVEVDFGQVNIIAGNNVLEFSFLGSAPYMDDVLIYSKQQATIAIVPAAEKPAIVITNQESELTIEEGATLQLNSATTGLTWASSNEAVATVNATSGLVTAVAKGTANITARKDGMKTAKVTITVTEKIAAGEIRAQAENGTVNGAAVGTDTDIVTRTTSTGETCTAQWAANATLVIKFTGAAGSFKLSLVGRAGGQYGMSDIEDLSAVISLKLNNAAVTVPAIAITGRTFTAYEIGNVTLTAGENTLEIKALGEEADKAPNIDFFKFVPQA